MSSPSFSLTDAEDFMDLADARGPLESPAAVRASSAESETKPSTTLPSSPFEGKELEEVAAHWQDSSMENLLYKKHERFHFDDGNITFVVDGIIYRIHQYFLCRDSLHFANLVKNRQESSEGEASKSLLEPFILNGIDSAEFDALLAILYPTHFNRCELQTVKEWTSVLRLSRLWSFSSIRELAIANLEPIASAVDKIVLGRTCGVDAWITPGFVALCQRPSALTREEGHRLRMDDTILVANLREEMRDCNFHYLPAQLISLAVGRCLTLVDPWDASDIKSILAKIDMDVTAGTRAEADAKANADMSAKTQAWAQVKAKQEKEAMERKALAIVERVRKADAEARRKVKVEARIKAEVEAKVKAEEEAKIKAKEAKLKAGETAMMTAESKAGILVQATADTPAQAMVPAGIPAQASVSTQAKTNILIQATRAAAFGMSGVVSKQ